VVSPRALQWFGLLGAPFAWVAQFVFGYAITEAGCDPGGRRYGIPIDGWTTAATAAAAVVAVLAGLAALATFRATSDAGSEPPAGRVHFLATVGMTISVLFLFIILMGGLGAIALENCRQG
jgi:hypothetical protein